MDGATARLEGFLDFIYQGPTSSALFDALDITLASKNDAQ